MTIKLEVKDYCENCKDFEPYIEKNDISWMMGSTFVCTTITCERAEICERMLGHLEKKMEEKKGE